jgi:hypothetical protein
MKVYKFELPAYPKSGYLTAPKIIEILRFDSVSETPYFWAVVSENETAPYRIETIHTGDKFNYDALSISGTTLHSNGDYILHHFITPI